MTAFVIPTMFEPNPTIGHTKRHQIIRYDTGTFCTECGEFYKKGSDEYLRYDGIFNLTCTIYGLWVANPRSRRLRTILNTLRCSDSWEMGLNELHKLEQDTLKILHEYRCDENSACVTIIENNVYC